MVDARTTCRFAVDLPARAEVDGAQVACRVGNVSMGGAFVIGPALPIGTRITLSFSAPPHMEGFRSGCTARWSTPAGTGFVFDGLRALDTYALSELIRWVSLVAGPQVQRAG